MKYLPNIVFVLCFIVFSKNVLASPSDNDCIRPLTLSSTTDWFPFIYRNETGVSEGSDVAVLRFLLAQLNCELKVVHFPERRALFELKYGEFDIGLGASYNEERARDFYYSKQYRMERNNFAYHTNDLAITSSDSLQDIVNLKKIIAINLGGWYGYEIEQAKSEHNIFIYSDTAGTRLKMLHHKRVNIVIDDKIVLCSELEKSNYQDIDIHPLTLYETPIHFIFNKKTISQAFLNRFNEALEKSIEDGSLTAMLADNIPANCQF